MDGYSGAKISEKALTQSEATNKVWIPGNGRFKRSAQEILKSRVEPTAKGEHVIRTI